MKTNKILPKKSIRFLYILLGVTSIYIVFNTAKLTQENKNNADSAQISLAENRHDHSHNYHSSTELDQTRAFYEQKIVALENKIKSLKNSIEHLQQVGEDLVQIAGTEGIIDAMPVAESYGDEDTDTANQHQLALQLDDFIENEHFDAEWAETMEDKMANVVTDELRLEGNELVDTNCKSTVCRIEIGHQHEQAELKFMQTVANHNELLDSIEDVVTYRVSAEESVDGMAHSVFYIARKGHHLPVSSLN